MEMNYQISVRYKEENYGEYNYYEDRITCKTKEEFDKEIERLRKKPTVYSLITTIYLKPSLHGISPRHLGLIFLSARPRMCGPNFQYTTCSAICQQKIWYFEKKFSIPKPPQLVMSNYLSSQLCLTNEYLCAKMYKITC